MSERALNTEDYDGPLETRVLRLGYWRRIGIEGLYLAESLSDCAFVGGLSPHDVQGTLGNIVTFYTIVEAARRSLGDNPFEKADNEVEAEPALQLLEAHGPAPRDELALGLDVAYNLGHSDKLPAELHDLYTESFHWLAVGNPQVASEEYSGDRLSVPLHDGPRQVRDAGLALFHYLNDDTWLETGEHWSPPSSSSVVDPWTMRDSPGLRPTPPQ